MKGIISKCDSTGDSVLAQFDTENAQSVKVAQDKLTAFLTDCVTKFGKEPPVWGRRANGTWTPYKKDSKKGVTGSKKSWFIRPLLAVNTPIMSVPFKRPAAVPPGIGSSLSPVHRL